MAIAAALSLLAFPAGNGGTFGGNAAPPAAAATAAPEAPPPAIPAATIPTRTALGTEAQGAVGSIPAASGEGPLRGARRPLASPDYGVFNSVAVPIGGLKIQQTWRRLVPGADEIAALRNCAVTAPVWGEDPTRCRPGLLEMAQTAGLDLAAPLTGETLDKVNRGVNRFIAYGADDLVHGRADHWASIDEILALRRGDCEDYAIAKMWLLAALGMPLEHMQLVVLHDTRRRLYHAVLVVHYEGGRLVLDNTSDRMVSQDAIHDYLPLYSLTADNAYVHGFTISDPARISRLTPLGEIHPGLGVEPDTQGVSGKDLAATIGTDIML